MLFFKIILKKSTKVYIFVVISVTEWLAADIKRLFLYTVKTCVVGVTRLPFVLMVILLFDV